MTMSDERYRTDEKTRELLVRILHGEYLKEYDGDFEKAYNDIWYDARQCLKHYPTNFNMENSSNENQ